MPPCILIEPSKVPRPRRSMLLSHLFPALRPGLFTGIHWRPFGPGPPDWSFVIDHFEFRMGAHPLSSGDRGLACQEAVQASDNVFQVGGITALDFGRHEPIIADLAQGFANLRPVNVPFADILPVKPTLPPIHFEVLY